MIAKIIRIKRPIIYTKLRLHKPTGCVFIATRCKQSNEVKFNVNVRMLKTKFEKKMKTENEVDSYILRNKEN